MRVHVDQDAIPTVAVRSATEIDDPNDAVNEMSGPAAGWPGA
jgi:hypothetical protein